MGGEQLDLSSNRHDLREKTPLKNALTDIEKELHQAKEQATRGDTEGLKRKIRALEKLKELVNKYLGIGANEVTQQGADPLFEEIMILDLPTKELRDTARRLQASQLFGLIGDVSICSFFKGSLLQKTKAALRLMEEIEEDRTQDDIWFIEEIKGKIIEIENLIKYVRVKKDIEVALISQNCQSVERQAINTFAELNKKYFEDNIFGYSHEMALKCAGEYTDDLIKNLKIEPLKIEARYQKVYLLTLAPRKKKFFCIFYKEEALQRVREGLALLEEIQDENRTPRVSELIKNLKDILEAEEENERKILLFGIQPGVKEKLDVYGIKLGYVDCTEGGDYSLPLLIKGGCQVKFINEEGNIINEDTDEILLRPDTKKVDIDENGVMTITYPEGVTETIRIIEKKENG